MGRTSRASSMLTMVKTNNRIKKKGQERGWQRSRLQWWDDWLDVMERMKGEKRLNEDKKRNRKERKKWACEAVPFVCLRAIFSSWVGVVSRRHVRGARVVERPMRQPIAERLMRYSLMTPPAIIRVWTIMLVKKIQLPQTQFCHHPIASELRHVNQQLLAEGSRSTWSLIWGRERNEEGNKEGKQNVGRSELEVQEMTRYTRFLCQWCFRTLLFAGHRRKGAQTTSTRVLHADNGSYGNKRHIEERRALRKETKGLIKRDKVQRVANQTSV